MLSMLKNWNGAVVINGTEYQTIADAMSAFKPSDGDIHIILKGKAVERPRSAVEASDDTSEVTITVKPYMTKPSSPGFDFMQKFNKNVPMPCRIMTGVKVKETKGMVYMKLHAPIKPTITCSCCGKELTNPISRHYGIGPVCLSKLGIVADIDDVDAIKEELVNITWEGWVIRSAILHTERTSEE